MILVVYRLHVVTCDLDACEHLLLDMVATAGHNAALHSTGVRRRRYGHGGGGGVRRLDHPHKATEEATAAAADGRGRTDATLTMIAATAAAVAFSLIGRPATACRVKNGDPPAGQLEQQTHIGEGEDPLFHTRAPVS